MRSIATTETLVAALDGNPGLEESPTVGRNRFAVDADFRESFPGLGAAGDFLDLHLAPKVDLAVAPGQDDVRIEGRDGRTRSSLTAHLQHQSRGERLGTGTSE